MTTQWSLLITSNTFLNILAVPNNAAYCITPTLYIIPNVTIHLLNSFVTFPRAPSLQIRLPLFWVSTIFESFSLQVLVVFHFFPFLFPTSISAGTAILMMIPFCSSSYKCPNRLSLVHCCVVFYTPSEPNSHIHLHAFIQAILLIAIFPPKIHFLYCLISSVTPWGGPMVDTEGKKFSRLL